MDALRRQVSPQARSGRPAPAPEQARRAPTVETPGRSKVRGPEPRTVAETRCQVTDQEFEALLSRRHELRIQHEAYCEEVNGCRLSESSWEATMRNRVWAELTAVQEQIDAELETERQAELEGA